MSITIYEMMQLEVCRNFNIVAGAKGLNKTIKKIGILDHETGDMVYETFSNGQFILTTLYVIKDDISKLKELVQMMISVGASGLAIRSVYFDNIPGDVAKLADINAFPIIIYNDVYFEDVLAAILNAMKEKDEKKLLEIRVDSLLLGNPDNDHIRKVAYEINKNFKENHVVTYIKPQNTDDLQLIFTLTSLQLEDNRSTIIPYKKGFIIIDTFDKYVPNQIYKSTLQRLERVIEKSKHYTAGISYIHNNLEELVDSITESFYAQKNSIIYKKNCSFYNQIGVNKFLMPLIDNARVIEFYNDTINPIKNYDQKYSAELLYTAELYVRNNGNIKATAIDLNQHENTVRYRINKIYNLIKETTETEHQYEDLALAIKIHNIINFKEN